MGREEGEKRRREGKKRREGEKEERGERNREEWVTTKV